MQHLILKNETTIRSENQLAAEFLKIYAEYDQRKIDLASLKDAIKDIGKPDYWKRHGIQLDMNSKTSSFDKAEAIKLMREHGVPQKKIDGCTKNGTTKKISLSKEARKDLNV